MKGSIMVLILIVLIIFAGVAGYLAGKSNSSSTVTTSTITTTTTKTVIQSNFTTYQVYLDGIEFTDIFYPQNLPNVSIGPSNYTMFGMTPNRDPVIHANLTARWTTPLIGNFEQNMTLWNQIVKELGKSFGSAYRQATGIAVGPTEANGIVYVASDAGWVYGINVFNGKIIFELNTPGTLSMWEPLVWKGIGLVGLGGAMFDYQQGALNGFGGGHRGQYTGINGLLAFNATSGKPLWLVLTRAQAMPTGVIANGVVYWDTGDGSIYATNISNGKTLWVYHYDGSGNMASLDYYNGIVIAGFSQTYPTNMSAIVGVYAENGSPAYIIKLPFATTSSAGDAVMAVWNGYIVDGILGFQNGHSPLLSHISSREVMIVANATTGQIIYMMNITNITTHPSDTNNGFNPAIINGIIYQPTIAGNLMAINITNGKILWESPQLTKGWLQPQPTYYNGMLFVPAGNAIAVLNASNGQIIALYHTQLIMRQQLIIVGNTVIETSGTNWVFAIPISQILENR
ncbi:hypothetical protein KN1_12280 [Stygiolobus caldivivus]|uniref:Pyrrolo-quinoline quinone repeat domain-containing protein n=1 Tax=Stygiolobus caldivivus TaxID=2824673 RepID=A0A8D5ZIT9_9CREN|nr:hypothetical protein KN1_12280 [Stygiolobus caldivivus]